MLTIDDIEALNTRPAASRRYNRILTSSAPSASDKVAQEELQPGVEVKLIPFYLLIAKGWLSIIQMCVALSGCLIDAFVCWWTIFQGSLETIIVDFFLYSELQRSTSLEEYTDLLQFFNNITGQARKMGHCSDLSWLSWYLLILWTHQKYLFHIDLMGSSALQLCSKWPAQKNEENSSFQN